MERLEPECPLNHPNREIKVSLLGSVNNGVPPDLNEIGAAVIVPRTAVNSCAAVGGTGDFDGIGDVFHDDVSFVNKL